MKVGLIRCLQTEDQCPATTDLKVMREKKCAFSDIKEDIELIGINTCGGCPGKRTVSRAKEMINRGADTIVIASCITKGTPNNFNCPNSQRIKKALRENLKDSIEIIEYTH